MKNEVRVVGHTPGGWRVVGQLIVGGIEGKRETIIADINPSKEICDSAYEINPQEATANARLIAAAPELLEACKHALDGLEKTGQVGRAHIVKQAIAKAEGK